MKHILHITTHMGGGVGKVLADLAIYENETSEDIHEILLLGEPENTFFIKHAQENGAIITICNNKNLINQKLKNADIVILHWWHHPLMAKFLHDFPQEKIRLIICVHISGCTYPVVPEDFLLKADYIIFTSPHSYENPFWNNKEAILKKSDVVYGLGKLDFHNIEHTINNVPVIGYLGTLSFSKLNPNYLNYCEAVIKEIPNVKFILVGKSNIQLKNTIVKHHLTNNFEFTGYVNDVSSQFMKFDIFGYLLNPYHYGSTENAILEAMSYDIPVIALNQSVEKHIMTNMDTGILVNNEEEYVKAVKYLLENNKEKERIVKNAKKHIKTEFCFEKNVDKLNNIINKISNMEKKYINFNDVFGEKPIDWFLSCLGKEKELAKMVIEKKKNIEINSLEPIFKEKNKSSIRHFHRYFKDDEMLAYLTSLLRK